MKMDRYCPNCGGNGYTIGAPRCPACGGRGRVSDDFVAFRFTADIVRRECTDDQPPSLEVVFRSTSHPHLPMRHSVGLRHNDRKLAERLVKAVEAGVIFTNACEKEDIYGVKYLSAESTVLFRLLNSQLRKLGY